MMKCFILTMCLMTIFGGCKKEPVKDNDVLSSSIIGTWEPRQFSGWTTINYANGNGSILKFSDSTFEKYDKGQLLVTGKYVILKNALIDPNECLPTNHGVDRIVLNQNYSIKTYIQISGNKLTIVSGCVALDGGSETYEKQ